jgi:heme-degrading monooxygenase HmoA
MILEHVVLDVVPDQGSRFEEAFARAKPLIASVPGFRSLRLDRCIERRSRYLLLVEWNAWKTMLTASEAARRTRRGAPCSIISTTRSQPSSTTRR